MIYANFVLNSFLKYQDTEGENSLVDKKYQRTSEKLIEKKIKSKFAYIYKALKY